MLNAILVWIRFVILVLGGHQHVALENAALSSTVGRLQTRCEASKIAPTGPNVLDWAEGYLEGMEICSCDSPPETVISLAAETIQTVLVEVVAVERTRAPTSEFGDPQAGPTHGCCESTVGRSPCARGTAEAGIRDFGAHGFTTDAEKGQETIANLDDLSPQSCGPNGFCRFLYGCDDSASGAVRLRHLGTRSPSCSALQYHRTPDGGMGGRAIVEAFPDDTAPRYLLRDRDGIYGHTFTDRVEGMEMEQVQIAARSPWQNCYVERVIGSIRRECLNHMVVINDSHLRRVLKSYFHYYHRSRTHLALDKDAPESRQPHKVGRIVQFAEVGGLHHRYERRVA